MKVDSRVLNNFKNKLLENNYDVKFITKDDSSIESLSNVLIPSITGWDSFIHSDSNELIQEFLNNNKDIKEEDKRKYIDFLFN